MAVPVARVHLKMAHAALPALLPTPPKWKMLPLLPTSCVAAIILPKPLAKAKPSRADADERWDAHKTKSARTEFSATSSPRSTCAGSVRSSSGRGSSRQSATSPPPPPPKPGRADSAERWDAHKNKKAASPASSSSPPSGSSKWPRSRASSTERWDAHKKRCPPHQAELLDDGESSSTGSNDIDDTEEEEEEEEEILWKPRAMYAGPGFVVAAPASSMLPMPTAAFLVPVA